LLENSFIIGSSVCILLLNNLYSPWTFNNANPNERPNKVIKKQVIAALTISGLAYGNIFMINAIIFLILSVTKSLKN